MRMNTEINPVDMIDDLKKLLARQHFEIKTGSDEGYDWLEEHSVCIVVHNMACENTLEIVLEDQTEFTLFFAGYHCHYFPDAEDFECLCNDLKDILGNKRCAASIFYGEDKMLGDTLLDAKAIHNAYQNNFDFVLKHDEFAEKLKKYGGHVRYSFWNSQDDIRIDIQD